MDTVINSATTIELLLGGISLQLFVVYLILAIFGLIISLTLEVYKHWKEIQQGGGFSFGYWIKSNIARVFVSILVIIAGIIFGKEIIGMDINNVTAFLAGFTSDKIIDSFIKRKT